MEPLDTPSYDKDASRRSPSKGKLSKLRFRLCSRPVAPPGLMTGFNSSAVPLSPSYSLENHDASDKRGKFLKESESFPVETHQVCITYMSV